MRWQKRSHDVGSVRRKIAAAQRACWEKRKARDEAVNGMGVECPTVLCYDLAVGPDPRNARANGKTACEILGIFTVSYTVSHSLF